MYLVKRGANSNQAHLGLLDSSSRRLLLLEEATLLAWASWVASSSPIYSKIGGGVKRKGVQPSWHFVFTWNCWGKLFPWWKSKPRRFRNVSVGNYAKIFNRSSSFIIRSSLFFDLQPVSTPNWAFQFILCTRGGPHLLRILLFSFHLLSVPPFDVLQSFT